MKHRAPGEGTIIQLPSGSWRAQVSLEGRRLSHTAKSQQAARDWLRKIRDQIDQGLTYDSNSTTLEVFLKSWLENKRSQIRLKTYSNYEMIARKYLLPALGKERLKDITPGRVQAYYDELIKQGKGVRTIQMIHIVLHGCLSQAERLGLVARNPTSVAIVPRSSKKEMQVWGEDEVSQFLVSIRGHRNEVLFHLALATGMRRGELLGLKWSDVDWMSGTITVSRQVFNPRGGGYLFQPPKTERGRRTVKLGRGLVERLRAQDKNVNLMRKLDEGRWTELDLIFPSSVGTPQDGDKITHEFIELAKKSGLPRIRFHDCRHTAATMMLSHGIPAVIVAGMLGHSLGVLMERYAHFIPTMQDEAAALMDHLTSPEIIYNG